VFVDFAEELRAQLRARACLRAPRPPHPGRCLAGTHAKVGATAPQVTDGVRDLAGVLDDAHPAGEMFRNLRFLMRAYSWILGDNNVRVAVANLETLGTR